MKLIDALEIIHRDRPPSAASRAVYLACGFTPLHLRTFLQAHLQSPRPHAGVEVTVGLFGDLPGNLQRARASSFDGAAVILEWADLDPRLGFRQFGGWGPQLIPDIINSVRAMRARVQDELERLSQTCPVALCLPTLRLAPVAYTAGWQASALELELLYETHALAIWAAGSPRMRVLNSERLDRISPPGKRRDARSELATGFPYTQQHADALASLLAMLLDPPQPKKGLITDLDNTLWGGILGEAGVRGISWDHAGSHVHGVYQQFLSALAESGALIGVASKNDPKLVDEAFERPDLYIHQRQVFPVEAQWGPKSQSVSRILKTWNIGADSVVFVDDSPMELAEVKGAHPEIECFLFPKNDPAGAFELIEHLRDLFGKSSLSEEDRIRAESLRRTGAVEQAAETGGSALEDFLAQANSEITFQFSHAPDDRRAFELANKTNQFNLNGRRYTEAEWQRYFDQSGAFQMTVGYKDRFGPLGTIAVVLARVSGHSVCVDTWAMSCRAFSRRIEHQCLHFLFDEFRAEEIALDFQPTPRNGPIQEFLSAFGEAQPDFRIGRASFQAACPPLYHSVSKPEFNDEVIQWTKRRASSRDASRLCSPS